LKPQSPATVLFRTTLTWTVTLYKLLILLGSNHYNDNNIIKKITVKTFTGLKLAVSLQPSTDKNGIQDEYNIYRKGEIKRKI